MRQSGISKRRRLSVLMASMFFGLACGEAKVPVRPLPAYEGQSKALFDDVIDPAAVGLDFDKSYAPGQDPTLKERVRQADAVLRAKVMTITGRTTEGRGSYQLALVALDDQLIGPYPPDSPFLVRIDETSPSNGIVKHLEGGLVGKTFIVFAKAFQRADGDQELHAHLSPDTKATARAISDAQAKDELRK
jgi:hypothetical protein